MTRKVGRGGKPISIYYFQRWNSELRRYETARSTGQTNRAAAETWAAAQLAGATDSKTTLAAFAAGMFDEGSEYLRHRAQRGREMSWNHRTHNAHYLERYVLPFSRDSRLADITASTIERFQSWLLERPSRSGATLAPNTCNHVVGALRLVIKRAIREQLIRHDPFVGVESLAANPKRRGILEPEEVRRLFALGAEAWPDPNARALNMVAAACGLRKGELQGLRRKCVQETVLEDGRIAAILVVNASWERSGRLKSTKSGRGRLAPVPPVVYRHVAGTLSASPFQEPDHFVFYSADSSRPVSHRKIDADFARALATLGINHVGGLPPLRAQQVIGHTSLRMTGNYLHAGQDFSDVLAVTDRVFEP